MALQDSLFMDETLSRYNTRRRRFRPIRHRAIGSCQRFFFRYPIFHKPIYELRRALSLDATPLTQNKKEKQGSRRSDRSSVDSKRTAWESASTSAGQRQPKAALESSCSPSTERKKAALSSSILMWPLLCAQRPSHRVGGGEQLFFFLFFISDALTFCASHRLKKPERRSRRGVPLNRRRRGFPPSRPTSSVATL